jgi:hypothetical protein
VKPWILAVSISLLRRKSISISFSTEGGGGEEEEKAL